MGRCEQGRAHQGKDVVRMEKDHLGRKEYLDAVKAERQIEQCEWFYVAGVRHGKEQRRIGL